MLSEKERTVLDLIDDGREEIIEYLRKLVSFKTITHKRGARAESDDDLALDVITKVGPRGHFLAEKHTRRQMREIWIPGLTHPRPSMDGKPLPDIRRRAKAELDRILAEHHPEPLEEAAQAELQTILEATAQEFVVHS